MIEVGGISSVVGDLVSIVSLVHSPIAGVSAFDEVDAPDDFIQYFHTIPPVLLMLRSLAETEFQHVHEEKGNVKAVVICDVKGLDESV